MTKSKIITIDDTPDSVAGRLPGFCATNPAGISITVQQERAPRGLIYFRVHCGDKKAASALLALRAEQGRCVIGWGWQHGITVLGKPGNRGDLQRCKDFCAKFLTHVAAKYPSAESAYMAASSGRPKPQPPKEGAGVDLWLDYYEAMNDAGYPFTLKQAASQSNPQISYSYLRKKNSARRKK